MGEKKDLTFADEFYSLAPRYRTKKRLQEMVEQEIEKARKESEEYGYRRGCIETCDLYFDGEGKEGFLKFWKKKQERELEIIKQLN